MKIVTIFFVIALTLSAGCKQPGRQSQVQATEHAAMNMQRLSHDVFASSAPQPAQGIKTNRLSDSLTAAEKQELLRFILQNKPFLASSPDVKRAPFSLNCLFNKNIYEKLSGNVLLGYSFDEGFHFSGNAIVLDRLNSNRQTAKYLDLFSVKLRQAAREMKLDLIENAGKKNAFGLGVAIVSVQAVLAEAPFSYPGLVAEFYFADHSRHKGLFVRYGLGKRDGLEKAMQEYCRMMLSMLLYTRVNT